MLVIDKNVNLEKLIEYGIHPEYECNPRTGETRIVSLTTSEIKWKKLKFEKMTKKIAILSPTGEQDYVLQLNENIDNLIDLDTLYKLIQAGIVRQVR